MTTVPSRPTLDPIPEAETTDTPPIRLRNLSTVLRLLGAGLVVAAASTFMVQRWGEGNDLLRYAMLLAHTVLLAGAGVVCGLGVKESRSARTLLALVVASIPVHFAVLGGVLRSAFAWDAASGPAELWAVEQPLTALAMTGGGLVVLFPLCLLAMRVLVRSQSLRLAAALFAMSGPVLLPLRLPDTVALITVAMVALWLVIERRFATSGFALKTWEGRFARLILAAPILVIVGRAALWYEPTLFFAGCVWSALSAAGFLLVPRILSEDRQLVPAQGALAFSSGVGWILAAGGLYEQVAVEAALVAPLFALPAALLPLGLSFAARGGGAPYRRWGALISILATSLNLLAFWPTGGITAAALLALTVGILTVGYAVYVRQKTILLLGGFGTLIAITHLLVLAIDIETFAHWGTLSALGVLLIFVAAVAERFAERLQRSLVTLRGQLERWEL